MHKFVHMKQVIESFFKPLDKRGTLILIIVCPHYISHTLSSTSLCNSPIIRLPSIFYLHRVLKKTQKTKIKPQSMNISRSILLNNKWYKTKTQNKYRKIHKINKKHEEKKKERKVIEINMKSLIAPHHIIHLPYWEITRWNLSSATWY